MNTHEESFFNAMSVLITSGEHSDVTIKCGNKQWKAHANILAARSTFFKAALSNEWKEAKTGVIEFPEEDPDVVIAMLDFIYSAKYKLNTPPVRSGSLEDELRVAGKHCEVGLAGEKYGINGLSDFARAEVSELVWRWSDPHMNK